MALVTGLLHQHFDSRELLKYDGKGVKDDVRDGCVVMMCHTVTYMRYVNNLSQGEKESHI